MVSNNYIKVDAEKFKKALSDRSITMTELSEQAGYEKSYFSANLRNGRLPVPAFNFAKAVLGLESHEYLPDTEKPKQASISQGQLEKSMENVLSKYLPVDYERLYKIIQDAVYEAVKKAWEE